MVTTFILVVHVVVSVTLILIILLQSGKGADIGAVFGGGSSQTVFGSTGATTFLSKVTIIAAVSFMVTSILLTYYSGRVVTVERSIMGTQSGPVVPGEAGPAAPDQSGGVPVPTEKPAAPVEKPASQPAPEAK